MTFRQFLLILRARWHCVILTLLGVVATTLVVSLILPKQYTSNAAVVVDVKSADPISGLLFPGQIAPSYMATQVDIIQSERVAQRVVKMLRLAENPTARQQWQDDTDGKGSIEVWLATLLQKKLDVKPSRESNVLNIAYTAVDPRFAAAIANAFAQAYVDTNLELKVEPAKQYVAWFDERTRQLRENFEKAQTKLSAYQLDKGIISVDERLDVENARLQELSSQLVQLQSLSAEARARQAQATSQSGGATLPEVLQNPLVNQLKSEVAMREAKLQEISGQLGAQHPQYQRLEAELTSLRAKLDAEVKRVASGASTSNVVTRQREADIRAALDAQRKKVLELKKVRDEVSVLQRDVDNSQRSFEAITQRLTQTNLESQANQTNILLLNSATEPIEHSSPKILLNTLLAVFLGTLLGVGLALLLEMTHPRVRSVEDLAITLNVPVLGVIQARPQARRWTGLLPKRRAGAAN